MDSDVKTFGPQRAYGYAMKFIVVYAIGMMIGLLALSRGWQFFGWLLFILFGFMMMITLMQTTALGSRYTLSDKQITAYHFFKKKELPYPSISQMRLLTFDEAVNILSKYDTEEAIRAGKMELKEAMQTSIALGKVIHFCTIQVKFSEKNMAKKQTNFIYLETTANETFLWSPRDCTSFFNQARMFWKR